MKKTTTGFTIVELLIVIVVIAILATISIVAYNGIQARAHNTAVQSDMSSNAKKLEEYNILNGKYPDSRTEFLAAGLQFTLGSHRYVVYCARNTGADTADWALISRASAGSNFYQTARGGLRTYEGNFFNTESVCTAVGITNPDRAQWLRGNGDWSNWVVY